MGKLVMSLKRLIDAVIVFVYFLDKVRTTVDTFYQRKLSKVVKLPGLRVNCLFDSSNFLSYAL